MQMNHPFLLRWLEIARFALRDADLFDQFAQEFDLSDEEMLRLRDTLDLFLGEK